MGPMLYRAKSSLMSNKFKCVLFSFKLTIGFLSLHAWLLISFAVCTFEALTPGTIS